MFWVDRIADEIIAANPGKKEFIIRDEKTLSGQVHVGSLRGVVIHGVIAEALNKRGIKAKFIYEFNDADPMDGMPASLDANKYAKHMGKPLRDVPAPAKREYRGRKAKNLAEYFGLEFLEVIHKLGFENVEITWAGKLYDQGFYDESIKKVLAHPEEIRRIYKEVSGSEKPSDWMPLQMVCEKCGKVGTTKVTAFDGKKAKYVCMPDLVEWAQGCGHKGAAEPWRGRGKLPWKVEWPAKWASYHVDIEGAGKDHCAAGGSHNVGEEICKQVLKTTPPFNIPYEFFLLGGAKMSSSKGNASSAKAVSDLIPPSLLRFLMIMKEPNQPIEFSPEGETIPRLFDKYDEAGEHFFLPEGKKTFPDLDRLFYFSQLKDCSASLSCGASCARRMEKHIEKRYFPRFSKLAFLSQIPRVDIEKHTANDKGHELTKADKAELKERLFYIEKWLSEYAPDSYVYKVTEDEIPESAYNLSEEQKAFLKKMAEMLRSVHSKKTDVGELLHSKTHRLVKESGLSPREAFPAIYHSLLGKAFGPQVGWFLEALDRKFIIERFEEVSALAERVKEVTPPFTSDLLVIHGDVLEKFPDIKVAWVKFDNVKIGKDSPKLTTLIDELVSKTDFENVKKNSDELAEYKRIFKEFGVDPTKRKPSPVALVDRLANGKPFPRINDMVDLYNYIVIKYQVSVGAFNADLMNAPVVLRFSEKNEKFQGIMDKEKPLDAGELCYFDSSRLCLARDLCYLDAEITKMHEGVKNVYINVDATGFTDVQKFNNVLEELVSLVLEICGGDLGKKSFTIHNF